LEVGGPIEKSLVLVGQLAPGASLEKVPVPEALPDVDAQAVAEKQHLPPLLVLELFPVVKRPVRLGGHGSGLPDRAGCSTRPGARSRSRIAGKKEYPNGRWTSLV